MVKKILDFLPIRLNAQHIKQLLRIKILVYFASIRSIKIVLQASITNGNIIPFITNSGSVQINKSCNLSLF